jgi:hypothetical protein
MVILLLDRRREKIRNVGIFKSYYKTLFWLRCKYKVKLK